MTFALLHDLFPTGRSGGDDVAMLGSLLASAVVLAAAAVPARASGGRERMVLVLSLGSAALMGALALLLPDAIPALFLIPGGLVAGVVIDRRLKDRTTASQLRETTIGAAAFIGGLFIPLVVLFGIVMWAFAA